MPTLTTLLVFAAVSLGVTAVPGPSNFFILTRGVSHGRRSALAATLGIETASALRVILAVTGLAALAASSPVALRVIEWAGVGYLAVLGLKALRRRPHAGATGPAGAPAGHVATARSGLLVGLANPKMLLFYVAFLPQFIVGSPGSQTTQILVLGVVFWVIGTLWDLWLAYAAGGIGAWVGNHEKAGRAMPTAEGLVYLGLAGWTAATV